jgi:hypothetical protein
MKKRVAPSTEGWMADHNAPLVYLGLGNFPFDTREAVA